jgi:hypothetical protein
MKILLALTITLAAIAAIGLYSKHLTENDPATAYMQLFRNEIKAADTPDDSVAIATKFIRRAQDSVPTLHKDSIQLMKDIVNTIWIARNTGVPDWRHDKILRSADVQPAFPKGDEAFKAYLIDNINEPYRNSEVPSLPINTTRPSYYEADFVVNLDGSIQDIVVKCEDKNLRQIAIAAFKKMPRWLPAQYKGFTVRAHYHFKANF